MTVVETTSTPPLALPRLWPRVIEVIAALVIGVILAVPILIIAIAVKLTSRGPVIYWSQRVGVNNSLFPLPKFRTMRVGAPVVATHLLANAKSQLTPIGGFLRTASLDEIPQLWCILRGDCTFVGPRPALYNQDDLVALRTSAGVHRLIPGLTGWAQVNGRDAISIEAKVALDREYLERRSRALDMRILMMTVWKVVRRDDVSH